MSPRNYIETALLDVLPEGVPPSFVSIDSATWEGRGPRRIAVGRLTMFDGLPATVEVRQVGPFTSHRFTHLEGGACSFEDGAWVRVSDLDDERIAA